MQTEPVVSSSLYRRVSLILVFILMLLIFSSPDTVQAGSCRTYHWVKEGETTAYIAKTYGFKWREIAEANDLDLFIRPEVGTRLCIPPEKQVKKPVLPKKEQKARIDMFINGDRVYITVERYSRSHTYRVKARSLRLGAGGWFNLGYMETPEQMTQSFVFVIPSELRSLTTVSICLKDLQSDELICRKVDYPH